MNSGKDAESSPERGFARELDESATVVALDSATSPGKTTPSLAVVDAVASAVDRDVVDLPPLYTAIEPDALDVLFADTDPESPRSRSGTVSFEYANCLVTVTGDGAVSAESLSS